MVAVEVENLAGVVAAEANAEAGFAEDGGEFPHFSQRQAGVAAEPADGSPGPALRGNGGTLKATPNQSSVSKAKSRCHCGQERVSSSQGRWRNRPERYRASSQSAATMKRTNGRDSPRQLAEGRVHGNGAAACCARDRRVGCGRKRAAEEGHPPHVPIRPGSIE